MTSPDLNLCMGMGCTLAAYRTHYRMAPEGVTAKYWMPTTTGDACQDYEPKRKSSFRQHWGEEND